MPLPIADLSVLLSRMAPALQAGEYVFATADRASMPDLRDVVASIREPEGLSVVVPASVADRFGAHDHDRFAWITLTVHSDLQAVGLTAAFASALGREGISCNVVAGLAPRPHFCARGPGGCGPGGAAACSAMRQTGGWGIAVDPLMPWLHPKFRQLWTGCGVPCGDSAPACSVVP